MHRFWRSAASGEQVYYICTLSDFGPTAVEKLNRVLQTPDGQRANLYILVYGAIARSKELSLCDCRDCPGLLGYKKPPAPWLSE